MLCLPRLSSLARRWLLPRLIIVLIVLQLYYSAPWQGVTAAPPGRAAARGCRAGAQRV